MLLMGLGFLLMGSEWAALVRRCVCFESCDLRCKPFDIIIWYDSFAGRILQYMSSDEQPSNPCDIPGKVVFSHSIFSIQT